MRLVFAGREGLRLAIFLAAVAAFCLPASTRAATTAAQSPEAIIAAGMIAWRAPNAQGVTCASCHSPDGFELARFAFNDADLRPRDAMHAGLAEGGEADRIVAMIRAVRERHGLSELLDPLADRPLQPGGQVIAGATSRERDFNTAVLTFAPRLPTLFNGRVDSILEAIQARDEVLAFDLRAERIGVPFPLLAETIAHGPEHGTLNDWIADLPRVPKPGIEAQWYALHDAYLADPSEANLWAIYNAVEPLTTELPGANANAFSVAKYQSLLLGQHLLREATLGRSDMASRRPIAFLTIPGAAGARTKANNPAFEVGTHAHRDRPAEDDLPHAVLDGLNAPLDQQLEQMMLPWWFMAWTFNPGLADVASGRDDFLLALDGRLGGEPYPIHQLFARLKIDLTRAYVPYSRAAGQPPQVDALALDSAAREFDDAASSDLFHDEAHRQLYRAFAANIRRTQLYLLLNELNKQCADNRPYVDVIGDEAAFVEGLRTVLLPALERVEPTYAGENRALVEEVIRRLQEGWNRCQALPAPGAGSGLLAEHFDDLSLSIPLGTRIDARVNFVNTTMAPDAGAGVSIRWSGQIEPRFSETYEISVRSGPQTDSGFRLSIDGQVVIDTWDGPLVKGRQIGWEGDRHFGADVALQAGKRHTLRLEYRERGTRQSVQLLWHSARQLPEIIPASQLYP